MIDLYTWTAPNAHKVSIMLEETALPYVVHAIDLTKGEQRSAEFLAVNPNGKVPAIVDRDGPGGAALTLTESGAILIHLAEKSGRLLARDGAARAAALQWLMFQMSAIGPTFHDAYYFMALAPERLPLAIDYFMTETTRVLGLLEAQLARQEFLAGDYSIADVATYPWIAAAIGGGMPGMEKLASLQRWYAAVGARPAVARGMAVPAA
jgi:GST-like protein